MSCHIAGSGSPSTRDPAEPSVGGCGGGRGSNAVLVNNLGGCGSLSLRPPKLPVAVFCLRMWTQGLAGVSQELSDDPRGSR